MPIKKKDVDGSLGHIITARGVVTDEEFVEFYHTFFSQDEEILRKYIFNISDYTEVTRMDVSSEAIKRMARDAKLSSRINDNGLVAVVGAKGTVFGLARMWGMLMYGANWEIMVFEKRDLAERWIRQKVKEKYKIDNLTLS